MFKLPFKFQFNYYIVDFPLMSQISTQNFVAPTLITMPSGQDFVASTMTDNMDIWSFFPAGSRGIRWPESSTWVYNI